MRYDGYGGTGWGMLLVFLALLLFFGLLAALVVWALTQRSGRPPAGGQVSPPQTAARGILDERFARGEIDEEEYRRRRMLLEGGPNG